MSAVLRLARPALRSYLSPAPRTIMNGFFNKGEDGADKKVTEAGETPAKEASEHEQIIAAQLAEIKDITDKYKRALAENENVRRRAEIEVQNAKEFAIQKFCKDIIPVADVLQAALDSLPAERLSASNSEDLKTLFEGVGGTHKMMLKVFERNGLSMINPIGDKFDPNQHEALCEVPDPTKGNGVVAFVQKTGFVLKGRVIRPAAVAVVRNQ